MRHLRQHVVQKRVIPGLSPQPCFDVVLGPLRAVRTQQQVDIEAVAAIGRHPSRRGVGLAYEALLLESGENAADRRR
jgi:hypothetical protein